MSSQMYPPIISAPLHNVWNAAITLFLFNKSDIKTIVFPVTVFAESLTSSRMWNRLPLVIFWVWFELLECTLSNQTFGRGPTEDALNKPDRPIPAKRITLSRARTLRLLVSPLNVSITYLLGAPLPAALGINIFAFVHNEMGASEHWVTKNGVVAILYGFFEMGATCIADGHKMVSSAQGFAVFASVLIIFTTIYAQDFHDLEGDLAAGRKTFPLIWPRVSKFSIIATPLIWTSILIMMSNVHSAMLIALAVEAGYVGWRFNGERTAQEYRHAYLHYNVWLCLAHVSLSSLDAERGLQALAKIVSF